MKKKASKTILLVEDEAITAIAEAKTLEKHGYLVLTAFSGDKAIDICANSPDIDLILMDVDLGRGMDGTQAAETILKTREVPVLFLSNHTEPEIVDRTEKITSYGYVVKNSGDTVLLASIRMAFKLHDANRELRRQQEELRKSQELLSLIFDNTPNAITITDAETNIVIEANKGIEWTGWASEEIIGKNPATIMNWVHPDKGDKIREMIDQTGKCTNYRIEFFKKDGTIAHAIMNSVLIRIDDRPHILTISNDVTKLSISEILLLRTKDELEAANEELNATVEELEATNEELQSTNAELEETKSNLESLLDENKRTLQALQESEYFLRRSQEIGRIGSFILERPRPGQSNYGWRSSQVMNDIMGIDDTYPKTREGLMNLVVDPAAIMEHIKSQVHEKKGNFELEYQIKRQRDGEVRWIYGLCEMLFDDEGNLLSMMGTTQDITERKRAEEELKKFQYTVDQSTETIFWLTRDGGFEYVNGEACRSLGYTSDELMGMKIFDIDPVLTKERWDLDMARFYSERKGGSITFESMHRHKDGTLFPVEIRAQVLWFGERDLHVSAARNISERKRAEEMLQQERIFSDAVIDSIPGLLYLYDEEGHLRRWSKSLENLSGYMAEELEVVNVLDWFKHDLKEEATIKTAIERTFTEGHATAEATLVMKNGRKIPYYFTATLLEIQGRKYFTGIGIDITEHKKTEEALERSNELLRTIIDAAPTAIIGLDLDGLVQLVWNPAAEKMLGWSAGEVMDKYLPTVDVDKKEEFDRFREMIRSGKRIEGIDVRRRKKDGTPIDYSIYGSPLHDLDGNVTGTVAVLVDITERKRAEKIIAREREFISALLDGLPGLFTLSDERGRYIQWNKNFSTVTGYSDEEIERMSPLDFVNESVRSTMAEYISRVFTTGETQFETDFYSKNGSFRPYLFKGKLFNFEDKPCIIGMGFDISDRRQAEKALGDALLEKEALLRELQHRMKNSLAMITSIIELEADRMKNTGEKIILNNLKRRIDSLTNLYTLLFQNGMVTEVALDEYIQSIVSSLIASFVVSTDTIRIEPQCERLRVSIKNATAWGLIVNELLTNALKYASPKGGKGIIRISLKVAAGKASLSVSDNGSGPPSDFNIEHPAGFGLLLVHMLTRQLGGALSFTRGTENVFTVRAPA